MITAEKLLLDICELHLGEYNDLPETRYTGLLQDFYNTQVARNRNEWVASIEFLTTENLKELYDKLTEEQRAVIIENL